MTFMYSLPDEGEAFPGTMEESVCGTGGGSAAKSRRKPDLSRTVWEGPAAGSEHSGGRARGRRTITMRRDPPGRLPAGGATDGGGLTRDR